MRSIYLRLAGFEEELSELVLAVVINATGSTPAKAGSSALFNRKGLVSGTVGGGILEARVTTIARECSGTGKSGIHNFEFDNDISRSDEAICGGRVSVLIDAQPGRHQELFKELKEYLLRRITVVLATSVRRMDDGSIIVDRALYKNDDKNIPVDVKPGFPLLLETITPQKRLIIAGAGHIGKVLCQLGNLLDFEVTVIDDRPEFANHQNLPDAAQILVGDIGTEMEEIKKGPDTYIVIVTRGHNDDSNALQACIDSNAAYIGMIGSKTKVEKMKRNFIVNGWATPEQWDSIHSPIGLEIGSQSVEEIAVSIAAELVLVRNRG